jgi:hypothetical protein
LQSSALCSILSPTETALFSGFGSDPEKAGLAYVQTLRTVVRNSYSGHYRRMTPKVIQALEFRSNNEGHAQSSSRSSCYAAMQSSKAYGQSSCWLKEFW